MGVNLKRKSLEIETFINITGVVNEGGRSLCSKTSVNEKTDHGRLRMD